MYLFGCCARRHTDADREVSLLSPKIDNNEKQQNRRSTRKPKQPHYGLVGQGHPRTGEGQGGPAQGDAQAVRGGCGEEREMHCLAVILPDGIVGATGPGADRCVALSASSSALLLDEEDSDGGGGGGGLGMVEADNPAGEGDEEEEVCFSKSSEDSRWSTMCEASNGSSVRDANSGGGEGGSVLPLSADLERRIVCDSPDTGISWSFPDITSSDDQGSCAAIVGLDSPQVNSSRTTSIGRPAVFIDANRPGVTVHSDPIRFGHQRIPDSVNALSSGIAQQSIKTKDKDQEQLRHAGVISDKTLTRNKSFSNDVVKVTQYVIEAIDRVCDSFADCDQNNLDKKNIDFNENSEIPKQQIDENKNESHATGKDSIYFQDAAISGEIKDYSSELLMAKCVRDVRLNNNGCKTKATAPQLKDSNYEFVSGNSDCEDEEDEEAQSVNSKEIYFRNTFELNSEDDFLREEDFNYSLEHYDTNEYEPYQGENRGSETDQCMEVEKSDEYYFDLSRSARSADFDVSLNHQQSENLDDIFNRTAEVFVKEIFKESLEELMNLSVSCPVEEEEDQFPADIPAPISDFFQHMELLSDEENEDRFELIGDKTELSASSPLHRLDLILEREKETICPPTQLSDIDTVPTGDKEPPVGDDEVPLMTNTSTDVRGALEVVIVNERIFPYYDTEIHSNDVEAESVEGGQLGTSTVAETRDAVTGTTLTSTDSNTIKSKEVPQILALDLDEKIASGVDPENTADEGYLSHSCTDSCAFERSGSIEGTLSLYSSSDSTCNRSSLGQQHLQFDVLDWIYDDIVENPSFNSSLNSAPSVGIDAGNGSGLTTPSVQSEPLTTSNEFLVSANLNSDRNDEEKPTSAPDSPAKETIDLLSYGCCPGEDKAVSVYTMDGNESIAEELSLIECSLPGNTANDFEHCCRLVTTYDAKNSDEDQTMTDQASKEFVSLYSKGRKALDKASRESENVDDLSIIDCDLAEQIRNASEQMYDTSDHVYQEIKQNHCSPEEIRHGPEQSHHETEQNHHEAEQIHCEPEQIHYDLKYIHNQLEHVDNASEQVDNIQEIDSNLRKQDQDKLEQVYDFMKLECCMTIQNESELNEVGDESRQVDCPSEYLDVLATPDEGVKGRVGDATELALRVAAPLCDFPTQDTELLKDNDDPIELVAKFPEHVCLELQLVNTISENTSEEIDEMLDQLCSSSERVLEHVTGQPNQNAGKVEQISFEMPIQEGNLLEQTFNKPEQIVDKPEQAFVMPQKVDDLLEKAEEALERGDELPKDVPSLCNGRHQSVDEPASITGSLALNADFFSMYIIDLSKNEFQEEEEEQQQEEITEKKKVGETVKKRFIVSSSKFELPSSRSSPSLPGHDSAISSMIRSDHLISSGDSCHDDAVGGGGVDDGDEGPLRPTIVRRSFSLKTSPTGTPCKKKAVRFADALGLELESIRHIRSSDEIPSIPNSAIPRDSLADPDHTVPSSRGYLGISFSQPGSLPDFLCRVFDQRVCLESCVPNDRDFVIKGSIRVFNMSYRKNVIVRYSTNSWSTIRDNSASYVMNSSDGTTDRFTFSIVLPSCFRVGNKLEFAICYRAGEDLGESFWDNNRNSNYVVECYSSDVEAAAAAGSDSPAWLHFL